MSHLLKSTSRSAPLGAPVPDTPLLDHQLPSLTLPPRKGAPASRLQSPQLHSPPGPAFCLARFPRKGPQHHPPYSPADS